MPSRPCVKIFSRVRRVSCASRSSSWSMYSTHSCRCEFRLHIVTAQMSCRVAVRCKKSQRTPHHAQQQSIAPSEHRTKGDLPPGRAPLDLFQQISHEREEQRPDFVYNRWPREIRASLWARFARANLFALFASIDNPAARITQVMSRPSRTA
jgi:hypothetical protein